ncbi:nucleosome remodeling complex atpase subunit [Moniliophthora roreri]|nr:nucleosome remodeling complex atpase subunit [Moniliophthora roreri]
MAEIGLAFPFYVDELDVMDMPITLSAPLPKSSPAPRRSTRERLRSAEYTTLQVLPIVGRSIGSRYTDSVNKKRKAAPSTAPPHKKAKVEEKKASVRMGSLDTSSDLSLPIDTDIDELDVMDMPITLSAPPKSSLAPRRSTRERRSIGSGYTDNVNKKRKAAPSTVPPHKKAKVEEKKNTEQNNEKRADKDNRRAHWLLRHREIVEPLLPSNSQFFTTLLQNHDRQSSGRGQKICCTPYHDLEEQPKLINKSAGEMKEYQLRGLSFLVYMYRNRKGLGKTLQTLPLFAFIREHSTGHCDPHLIVCPLSVLLGEAARWLPSFSTVRFHGSGNERIRLRKALMDGKYDLLVTTYDVFVAEDSWFKSRCWTYTVLDEGHKVKNSETNVSHKLHSIGAMYGLEMTRNDFDPRVKRVLFSAPYIWESVRMGSLDTSSDLSLPIDTDIDELDVMDMPITLSAPLPKSSPAPRRSTRERKSTGVRYTDSVNKKRKAAPSTVPSHKKAKVEEKKAEAARWLPSFRTVRFHGSGNERIRLRKALVDGKYDLLITTYDEPQFKTICLNCGVSSISYTTNIFTPAILIMVPEVQINQTVSSTPLHLWASFDLSLPIDTDVDELDVMDMPITLSAPLPKSSPAPRRSTRERLRSAKPAEFCRSSEDLSEVDIQIASTKREKLAPSTVPPHKKAKVEEKKANTEQNNEKRADRDNRRAHWLLRHREIRLRTVNSSRHYFKTMTDNRLDEDRKSLIPLERAIILGVYVPQWYELHFGRREAARWLPSFRTVRFHGSGNERIRLRKALVDGKYDLLITTYDEPQFKTICLNCGVSSISYTTNIFTPAILIMVPEVQINQTVNTEQNNEKRADRDNRRAHWLLRHREVVEPLLPSNSQFFTTLLQNHDRQSSGRGQKISYTPRTAKTHKQVCWRDEGVLDIDELDVMDMPITLSAPPKSSLAPRRSTRERRSIGSGYTDNVNKKRKAAPSTVPPHKKAKVEEKKANTEQNNEKRADRDNRRAHWLLRHREVVEPLLPSNSQFFTTLLQNHDRQSSGRGQKISYTPYHDLEEQPKLINKSAGEMKEYQTLSLFAYIRENSTGHCDPHLIVCPLSVLSSWESEAARWLPSFRTVRFHGSGNERIRLRKALVDGKYDLLVTTYDVFVAEDSWFKSRRWTYIVLDEGHKIKNSETNISHKLHSVGAVYRLILTGTPVQNNLFELWSLFHFLYPKIFTPATEQLFRDSFDISRGSYSLPFVNAAKKFLSTVMIRRTKATVKLDIPPRVEQTIFIPLTEAQRFWTYRLLTKMDSLNLKGIFDTAPTLDSGDSTLAEGRREVFSMLQNQLQEAPTGKAKQTSSSKLICIDKILADVLPKGEKVLIFSQWYRMLDCLEDMLYLRGIKYARLDGSTSRPRRSLDIKLFQHESSSINLTKATTVIMADSDWNPQNDLQAIARAHRIGQKKTVQVYRLICGGSVEDQMLDRLRRKLFLSVKLMGSDNTSTNNDSDETSMNANELMDILRKGSSALVQAGGGIDLATFLAAPISEILETSKARENARDAKLKHDLTDGDLKKEVANEQLVHDAEEEERRLLSGIAQVRCRLFEGQMVEHGKEQKKNRDIADEWVNLQKRRRSGKETVEIGGMTFVVDQPPVEVEVRFRFFLFAIFALSRLIGEGSPSKEDPKAANGYCIEEAAKSPKWWKGWQRHIEKAERDLEKKYSSMVA